MVGEIGYLLCIHRFLVVIPVNAEKNDSEGRKVRLSIAEKSSETERRESVMTPYPRISDGLNILSE